MDSNKKFGRTSQYNNQKADKGSCVVVWDRNDYIVEAEKQLRDKNIYQDVNFSDRILRDLVDKSNKMFRSLKREGKIIEKNSSTLRCIYFLKYIKGCQLFLIDQLSRAVGHQQRKFQNF